MSRFEIAEQEGFDEGVLRATAAQIEAAREALFAETPVTDELVHEARKHMKRARAVLRLATGTLSAESRRAMNRTLRDAGKALSAVRDRHVVRRMVEDLARNSPADVWVARALEALSSNPDEPPPIDWVATRLEEIRAALEKAASGRSKLRARGLRRSYERGREAMRAARREGHAADFHEWRKRAKDLRYQMEFLAPLWPGVLDVAAEDLARLTDLLGDANNVGVLLLALEKAQRGDPLPHELVVRLTERRVALWHDALELGDEIYSQKPKAFAAHMKACWEASRSSL